MADTVDRSTYLMLDDVDVSITESHDAPAFAVAGYIDGIYANWNELVDHYRATNKHLVSIAVTADATLGAQALDIETGDATIAEAPNWVKLTAAAGRRTRDLRWFPKVYTSASNVQALIDALTAAGIPRSGYMVWSAHYTGVAHICSPASCGYPAADATQYTDRFAGASLDGSMCYGYFFSGAPNPAPTPTPPPGLPAWPVPSGLASDPGVGSLYVHWNSVGSGANYHVQLREDGKVLFDQSTTDSAVTWLNIAEFHPFEWRVAVHADAAHESSGWSAFQSVTTLNDAPPAPAPPAPKPGPQPTLEPVLGYNTMGHGNPAVKLLQQLLNAHRAKFDSPLLLEDGFFGFKTLEAVKSFQSHERLPADGIVGPATWAKLGNYR